MLNEVIGNRVDLPFPERDRKRITGYRFLLVACSILFVGLGAAKADTLLDFEGFSDSTILTNEYLDVTFANAVILSSGISLNEFEFPPHSGTNVASDNNGPMSIGFSTPVTSFSGYFTYLEPLELDAFDASNNVVATVFSTFASNDALFGNPGSSPNEFLHVSYAGGISHVMVTGDLSGGSFTLDDATYSNGAPSVPESSSLALLSTGLALVGYFRGRFST